MLLTAKQNEFGRVDFVFANSGIAQMRQMRANDPTYFATTKHDDLESLEKRKPDLKVIDVNLNGVLYTCHAALAYFRAQELDSDGFRGKVRSFPYKKATESSKRHSSS